MIRIRFIQIRYAVSLYAFMNRYVVLYYLQSSKNLLLELKAMQPILNNTVQSGKFHYGSRITFSISCCNLFVCTAQQIKESDVPVGVRTIASEQSNNQPITMWVLDKKRGKYIATVISNTAVQGIEISLDGKWIETTSGVPPDKMPAACIKNCKGRFSRI